MTSNRKPFDTREKELRLALLRIERGWTKTGQKKVSIASVAREAGVSSALIHNHYPRIAEAIRDLQGRTSRAQRDAKQQGLRAERERSRTLLQELEELRVQIATIASLNEVLLTENRILNAKQNVTNLMDLPLGSKKS